MSVKKTDWLYLAVGTAATWWLTKVQNGDNATLDILRAWLRVVRWMERQLSTIDSALLAEIDKELDNYGR